MIDSNITRSFKLNSGKNFFFKLFFQKLFMKTFYKNVIKKMVLEILADDPPENSSQLLSF